MEQTNMRQAVATATPVLAPGLSGEAVAMPAERRGLQARLVSRTIKRGVDIVGATVLLILGFPLMIAIAALVAMDGGPVLYRHRRVGVGGKSFDCLKFRTMILEAEDCLSEYLSYHPAAREEWARDQKLAFDPRVTGIGKFLRKASLDELPQLINVVRGEMSLVGPRPVTQSELGHYGASVPLYASVRPGITGLWQVSGRNDVGYAQRVALDESYVRRWSLALDLWILLRTPGVVFTRKGAR